MKKSITIISILILLSFFTNNKMYAQDKKSRKAFISFNTGCYLPTSAEFGKIYGNLILINGISIGVPIANHNLFLYGKAMYFIKEGTPITYHFVNNNGIPTSYTTQEGSITINHFLFNLGLQNNFNLSEKYKLIVNTGFSLIKSKEKSDNPVKINSNGSGLSGLFIGLGLERQFSKIPLHIFSECQYNSALTILKSYNLDYSAINFNLGLRYYF